MPDNPYKHVVSVSVGSPSRNTDQVIDMLGHRVRIQRIGTGGDMRAAGRLISELDGKVDAIGLGGIDLFLMVSGRRYYLREAVALARHATTTPVVCGAALKDTLERKVVEDLDAELDWKDRKVLMVAAVDRFGMAEALDAAGAHVTYGDLIFALGLPIPISSLQGLHRAARMLLPVISRVPISWIYPTGDRQTGTSSGSSRARYFQEADVLAGDFHYIRRYAPADLTGKVVLTNTTTGDDVEDLRRRGVRTLITTTPRFNGRSLATNLLEAALIAISGRHPLSAEDYRQLITEAGLQPDVQHLNRPAA